MLDIIKVLNGWIIRGYREELILTLDKGNAEKRQYKQLQSLYWTVDTVSDVNKEYIKDLPHSIKISFDDKDDIKVVHGSPFDINEEIHPYDLELINKSLNHISEEVLVCGHTHNQWHRYVGCKLIVNPGSVGLSYNEECSAEISVLK